MTEPATRATHRTRRSTNVGRLAAAALTGVAAVACVSSPEATPAGTPAEIEEFCRELAAISTPPAPPSPSERATDMPGSADETIEAAQQAEQDRGLDPVTEESVYNSCIEERT